MFFASRTTPKFRGISAVLWPVIAFTTNSPKAGEK